MRTAVLIACLVAGTPAFADPVIRQATGANAAAIQAAVTSFRADLGEPNNGNTAGSQAGGRREVNWDGGGVNAPAQIFQNPQTNFQARGSIFTTPGTAMEQSGQPTAEFGEINQNYPGYFAPFSPPRLFAPLNSNIVDVHFFVPGTNDVRAAVTGFGAVFSDVDLETSTKMEFFAPDNTLLWEGFVPYTAGSESLSFLGVSFNEGELVGWVRITSGNAALGPDETGTIDLVVMDDFIFSEPVRTDGLTITPGTGQLFQTSAIDWTTGVVPPAGTALVGGRVKFNGLDVTAAFAACIQFGTISGGGDGNTLRCSLPGGVFPAGEQTLQIELDLSNGTRLRNAVRWTVIGNTEP
jgi:hypothetical protein